MIASRWIKVGSLALLATTWGANSFGEDAFWVNEKLKEFTNHPQEFIKSEERTLKYDPDTLKPLEPGSLTDPHSPEFDKILENKDLIRMAILGNTQREGRAPILKNDDPRNLVDTLKYVHLASMDEAKLTSSSLETSPWSDDYWPLVTGSIAKRYADPHFPNSSNWAANMNYILKSSCSIQALSPAEKYDLLVGDSRRTLTRSLLAEGKTFYDSNGTVETWMGICHGWAQASYMISRPSRAIELLASDGRTKIPFYPADIKALASLLWAKASPPTRFIGGRCNQKNPAEDQFGRIASQECFDTNPGTWHLSLVNQIGVSKRSFIFDATYDYEVWNQPILSYEYSYFNPSTRVAAPSLNQAIVARSRFRNDLFSRHRSPNSAYIVGIVMKVVYLAETKPKPHLNDSPERDRRVAVKYFYDLELDRNGVIIGGEWYQRKHPDFLWTPSKDARAYTVGDQALVRSGGWRGNLPLPALWQKAAYETSKEGLPLASIVETMTQLSQLSGE
jgi:hypothetical protein